jgi:ABC-type polysaccharide/polyol phosphate export permease
MQSSLSADRAAVRAPRSGDGLVESVRELFRFGDVLQELVKRDLKVRYKRSVLGIFWTMLNPLLMMVITTIVFSNLFKANIPNFPIYMLSGYVVWAFFSQATTSASTSIVDSAGLTRKVYLPPALLPLASIASALVNLVLSLIPLALLVAVTGGTFTPALMVLPASFLLLALFAYGLGLFLAASSVFFRDTVYTYGVLLVAWMYLTPLFYPPQIIPPQWAPLIQLNPVYHLVELVRAPVYAGQLPDPVHVAAATAFAVAAAVLGFWYFNTARVRFVAYL